MLKITQLGNKSQKLDEYFYHRIKRHVKKDGTISWENKLFEVPFELVGRDVYLVFDPHHGRVKWIESLEYERLGSVHPLDKIANNDRIRSRPSKSIPEENPQPKAMLVETLYQKTSQQFDITSSSNNEEESE